MRLLLTLTTLFALALAGCGGDTTAPTAAGASSDSATAPADDTDAAAEDAPDATDVATDDTDDADAPAADATDAAACSASGLPATVDAAELPESAHDTAELLLDAAVRCDEQVLFTAAAESETSFFFGSATVDQAFALPEAGDADPAPWEALARLLQGTTPVVEDGRTVTWPAAFAEDADDAAWQELVDSGLYSQAQVDELRAAPDGYLGYRTAIDADGDWLFFTAGD